MKSRFVPIVPAMALAVAGCAGGDRYILIGSAEAASTAGVLEVDADDPSSTVDLHLEFLGAPEAYGPGVTHYVVWFLSDNGTPTLGGPLHYVRDRRTADVERLAAPPPPFELLITAESSAKPAQPGEHRILSKAVVRD